MAEAQPRENTENLARVRGSRTAELVAAARAGHFARAKRPLVVEDPYAIHLAGERWQRVIGSNFRHWLFTRVLLRKLCRVQHRCSGCCTCGGRRGSEADGGAPPAGLRPAAPAPHREKWPEVGSAFQGVPALFLGRRFALCGPAGRCEDVVSH